MQMIKSTKLFIAASALLILISSYVIVSGQNQSMNKPFAYPPAKKVEQIDDYHGVKVADPYRWLEDDHSPETIAWAAAQRERTEQFLAAIPARERLRARLTKLWNYPRHSLPIKAGGNYVFLREGYGRLFGWLWGWVDFWMIRSGSIAALATAFTIALHKIVISDDLRRWLGLELVGPVPDWQQRLITISVILALVGLATLKIR